MFWCFRRARLADLRCGRASDEKVIPYCAFAVFWSVGQKLSQHLKIPACRSIVRKTQQQKPGLDHPYSLIIFEEVILNFEIHACDFPACLSSYLVCMRVHKNFDLSTVHINHAQLNEHKRRKLAEEDVRISQSKDEATFATISGGAYYPTRPLGPVPAQYHIQTRPL